MSRARTTGTITGMLLLLLIGASLHGVVMTLFKLFLTLFLFFAAIALSTLLYVVLPFIVVCLLFDLVARWCASEKRSPVTKAWRTWRHPYIGSWQ